MTFRQAGQPGWVAGHVVVSMLVALGLFVPGCRRGSSDGVGNPTDNADARTVQNAGSDTMVNVAQAWAERYAEVNKEVSIEVSGGGSGTGIAGLINGTVDIANCSRTMSDDERQRIQQVYGAEPTEYVVGYDAMAIFVHPDNPLEEITIQQLAEIFGENGKVTKWSDMGVALTGNSKADDPIVVVSRQSNSGTYFYFREHVLGKGRDFRLGTLDMHGSKDVVELVARTPNAIGYSGMGYATPQVKGLRIRKDADSPGVAPSVTTTLDGTYPIARPLLMYVRGKASDPVQHYLDWIRSPVGQEVLAASGYVPLQQAITPEKGKD